MKRASPWRSKSSLDTSERRQRVKRWARRRGAAEGVELGLGAMQESRQQSLIEGGCGGRRW
eukprot:749223-Hanusia_phi.AAC.2